LARIKLEGVSRQYGEAIVLQPTDLEIGEGEFVTLLGPSGCGKTTTLRIVAGFVRPSEGRIFLSGQDVTDLPPQKRNVGMVFQDYALFPHLTVAQNIGFGLAARGAKPAAIAERVEALLDLVQLGPLAHRRPAQLSGGQQQRVALARAIAHPPSVLLMDEPFAALDRQLREALQLELRRIQRTLGVTTLFVTHDHGEALSLSDRVAIMSGGRILQMGTPQSVYRQPTSRFAARFLGDVNLAEGKIVGGEGEWVLVEAAGRVLRAPQRAFEGPIDLGVRPEHLMIVGRDPELRLRNRLDAEIASRIFQGGRLKLVARIAGAAWTLEVPDDANAPVEGDHIVLGWDPTDTLVFDQ
jgi:putative spermidine/putrescine transport system ATP-binding protein